MFTRKARLFLGLLLALALPLNSGGVVAQAQGEVPTLYAEIGFDWVDGRFWPLGNDVTLTIEENGVTVYTDTNEVGTDQLPTYVRFDVWEAGFDLQPGHIVTLTDGTTTRTHTALDIGITNVNLTSGYVEGFAPASGVVNVLVHDPCWENVPLSADITGYWIANFVCDLNTAAYISAEMWGTDDVGVSTGFFWSPLPPPAEPTLYAEINFEWVDGWNWPLDNWVTLTIQESEEGEPIYEATNQVGLQDGDNQTYVRFDFWEEGFNLEPGHVVTLTDGITIKTHTVLNIGITQVNVTDNTVTGFAQRGTDLVVSAHDPCWTNVTVTADGDDYTEDEYAYWFADFDGICPLDSVEFVNAEQQGPDEGTSTGFYWEPPNVEVNILYDYVVGRSWLPGTDVTLTIDGPDIRGTENFTITNTVGADPESSPDTVQFDFRGDFYVQPGHVVILSDGGVSIVYEVEYFEVTKVDFDNNMVEGLAAPYDELLVTFGDTWTEEVVHADQTGKWSMYHEDLASENWGMVRTPADYGNNTSSGWDGPIPTTYNIKPWWSDVTVRAVDEVNLNLGWGACTPGLVKTFQQAAHIDITINGEPLYPEGDDGLYWGTIEPLELDGCKAAPNDEQGSVSRWGYTLSPLEPGIYEVYVHYWLAHPIVDGGDWDGDGKIDKFEGTFVENTVLIVVK